MFQTVTDCRPSQGPLSNFTGQPPPRQSSRTIARIISRNNLGVTCVSASTNTSQSPLAARPAALRDAAIWLNCSNTTRAPLPLATAAVSSVELLSQRSPRSSIPLGQALRATGCAASSDTGRYLASLKAGMTIEISTWPSVTGRAPRFNLRLFLLAFPGVIATVCVHVFHT